MRWIHAAGIGLGIAGGAFIGWLARGAASPSAAEAPAGPAAAFAALPDVRQSTTYSCGASVLQAILLYYGIEEREDALMQAARTTEAFGTHPEDILRVAREHGLRAELREGLTLADLEAAAARRVPVVVALQAWTDSPGPDFDWSRAWEDGHYVIVVGLDEANVMVEDPSLLGCRGIIPRAEFLERWHDYEGDPPYDPADRADRAYVRMGMFIESGRPPAPGRPFCRVD
jgi:hypothetical protein